MTNTYNVNGTATIQVKKDLKGRDWTNDDAFTFTLEGKEKPTGVTEMPMPDTTTLVCSKKDADNTLNFGEIAFNKAGTYTYVVKETTKDNDGITYAANKTITFELVDNGQGKLVGKNNSSLVQTATMTNTYEAKGTLTFEGTKTLEGRDLKAGDEFEFAILKDGTPVATAKSGADGKIAYPELTYTKKTGHDETGTYTYTVKETSTDGNGITVDTTVYTVTVEVKDLGNGVLDVTKTGDMGPYNFTNTYEAKGTLTFEGTKTLEGRDLKAGDEFEFAILKDGTPVATAKSGADGKIAYPELTYTKKTGHDETGTYTYTVKETSTDGNGITVDTTVYTVTVEVKDLGNGVLDVTKTGDMGPYNFTNTYEAKGTATILVKKDLVGRDWTNDDAFTFDLKPVSNTAGVDTPVPGTTTLTIKQDDENQTKSFGEIDYTKPGTYTYTVQERQGSLRCVTYDTTEHLVTIVLEDNGLGKLVAKQGDSLVKTETITNTYEKDYGSLTVHKTFGLESVLADGMLTPQQKAQIRFTYVKEGDESVTGSVTYDQFTNGSYTWEDLPLGTYKVTESGADVNDVLYTLNATVVADLNNNSITPEHGQEVTITNIYTRNLGSLVIHKSVTLNGKATDTKAVDGTYLFTIRSVEGVEPATSATVSVTVTNGRMSGAKLEKASSDQLTVLLTDGGAQISGLPTGEYTVVEDETGLAEKHIQLTDKPTKPILVTKAGAGEIPTAAFVNNRTTYVSAAVRKVWDDDGNRDGLRPAGITLKLLANGVEYRGGDVTLNEANHWTALLEGLPETDEKGEKIAYTWTEPAAGSGYTLSGKVTEGALTVLTNRHAPEETKVSVKKVWNDRENELKKRPDSITVQLYADGLAEGGVVTLNAGNNWEYSWDHLKKNTRENGQTRTIAYTVAETQVPDGYISRVTGSAGAGYVITNTIEKSQLVIEKEFDIQVPPIPPEPEEETTDIEIVKIWDDQDNADGNRPASITVRLYAGGVEVKSRQLTAANGWKTKFGELPKFVNGHPIHYSVLEDPVEWYSTEIHGFTITNHYHPETTSVSVRKVWNDENNKLKIRPKSVRMTLNNGISVILNERNGWQATVGGLPARVNGQPAVYTWTEQEIIGYELESKVTDGNTTVFTNRPWTRPDEPSKGKKPRLPGETLYVFEEYDTPLGVEIVINHVGDCFD